MSSYEGAHAGYTANQCLLIAVGGKADEVKAEKGMTPEEMREYIESAPDHVDVRVGYAQELAERIAQLPGPKDQLKHAARWAVRNMSHQFFESPLGAIGEAGLPLSLHPGPGRSPTYELAARSFAKRLLPWMEAHPEHASKQTYSWLEDADDLIDDAVKGSDDWPGDPYRVTGFQWGWALNACKYVLGLPPVPNPSLATIPAAAMPAVQQAFSEVAKRKGGVAVFDDIESRGRHD